MDRGSIWSVHTDVVTILLYFCVDTATIDADISLKYTEDDIRLCTMQRAVLRQKLGVSFCYYDKGEKIHYIKLTEDLKSSLAMRAGIKSYDRIITLNGVNVENDTQNQFMERFESERHLPVQMLLCSPATYQHYRTCGKPLHHDLRTIQRLQPVYASSSNRYSSMFAFHFDYHSIYS